MKISSRYASAVAPGPRQARAGALSSGFLAIVLACLAGCAGDPAPARASAPTADSRALAADLNARLEALQRQPEPASDDVIASLERTLREQREKRARAIVAAGTTTAVPSGASGGVAAPAVPLRPVEAAPPAPPVAVAAASTPSRPVHMSKAQARAAAAAAARQAAATRQNTPALAPGGSDVALASGATALPPLHPVAQPLPATMLVPTSAAAVVGPARTPMSRTQESHLPVDELYARARELELQAQVIAAIGLYREASQRGHAPSSQRLMELYADGAPGVARDYRVAVFFKERAVQQGASFDPVWRR